MNVVDTSAWLAFFTDGKNAKVFSGPIKQTSELIVPTICLYELSKIILREHNEDRLVTVLAALQRGRIIELSPSISIQAATLSLRYKLPMADSIIYATARKFEATVWTQDVDFQNLPHVNYYPKK